MAAAAPAAATVAAAAAAFMPAAAFAGAKPGYVFKMGAQGVGYYADAGPLSVVVSSSAAGGGGGGTAGAVVSSGAVLHQSSGPGAADGDAADKVKRSRQEMIAEQQAARNAALAKHGRSRAKAAEELDPMDPVREAVQQYSSAVQGQLSVMDIWLVAVLAVLHSLPDSALGGTSWVVCAVHAICSSTRPALCSLNNKLRRCCRQLLLTSQHPSDLLCFWFAS